MIRYLLLFLLVSNFAFAEKINVYPPDKILKFRGLDDTSSLLSVQDERASAIQNVKLSLSSALQKRKGYNLVNDRINEVVSSENFPAITGLFYAKLSSGSEFRLVIGGRRIYKDVTGTWTDITTPISITYDKNNQFVWVTALDTIVFSNDTDPPFKWTGTGNAADLDVTDLSDTLTKTKTLAWFKNYLIFGNTLENSTERPTRFRWSNVGTVETFSDDDFIDIAALGGQEINGLIELYDNLYILMTDSIWKATLVGGDEIFVISKVVDDIGCIAKNSIQTINLMNQRKGIVFLAKDKKVYFFDGSTLGDITTLITGAMGDLRADRLQYAVSADTGKSYLLAVTTGNSNTSNNLLLEFQYEMGEWTKHTQIDANAMAKVVDSDSLSQIYYGNYDSFVYVTDTILNNDITGQTDGVSSIETADLSDGTATGLTVIVTDTAIDYSATGAIVSITSGTGVSEEKVIITHDSTSLVVDSAFTATPTSSSIFSIGAVDAFYTTKWFDLSEPSRIKHIGDLYLWTEESSGSTLSVEESLDFASILQTENVSMAGTGGLWGVALWNVGVWGGQEAIFTDVKLTGEGRYIKLNFKNSAIDETFNILGYNFTYRRGDVQ